MEDIEGSKFVVIGLLIVMAMTMCCRAGSRMELGVSKAFMDTIGHNGLEFQRHHQYRKGTIIALVLILFTAFNRIVRNI